jgi:hypothetical protein
MEVKNSVAFVAVLATAALAPLCVRAQGAASAAPASSAPARLAHAVKKKAPVAAERSALDLRAPPLSHIYPSRELQYILAVDTSDADSAQEISVSEAKYVAPVPMGQLQAIPWAILHPTQAWRVFTPLEAP